ncbi:MAG: ribonuclease HII [Bacteroidales bacterium]|jgi:ribonuclease HII|nr:ribonuclease HII [Bacteroidales bacterium]
MALHPFFNAGILEAGCDEAGRGCLAGPVVAAAVVLDAKKDYPLLNDSKKLTAKSREILRQIIEKEALAWAVGFVSPAEIDKVNILQASFLAMHRALDKLAFVPEHLLIDGNRFNQYKNIQHQCIIGGDALYQAIAAASILAKTHRDAYMREAHDQFPLYGWNQNKGYPTKAHKNAIANHGVSPLHRLSFNWRKQLKLPV